MRPVIKFSLARPNAPDPPTFTLSRARLTQLPSASKKSYLKFLRKMGTIYEVTDRQYTDSEVFKLHSVQTVSAALIQHITTRRIAVSWTQYLVRPR